MEKLRRMGKSWFIVTKYDELFGTNIGDSIKIKSLKLRNYEYERTKENHKEYLEMVLKGNTRRLGVKSLKITSEEIVEMAKKCLDSI